MIALALRVLLIRPGARTGETGAVLEFRYGGLPWDFAPTLFDRVPPILAFAIAAVIDELLVVAITHFILIDEIITELHAAIRRPPPTRQAVLPAVDENHARRGNGVQAQF